MSEKRRYAQLKAKRIRFHFVEAINFSVPFWVTDFPLFLSLEALYEKSQPDIIHANNLPFLTTFQLMRLSRRHSKIGVVHVHGEIGGRGPALDFAQRMFIRTIGYRIFQDASKVICLTPQDALRIRRYGCPEGKIRVIPNGVDVEKFRPRGGEVDDLILWGGRFVWQKGLEYLIDGLRIVAKRHPTVKLAMTGNGPLLSKIRRRADQHKLTENVTFMGVLPRREIPLIINKASIYVLPSLNEGMPYALLEAMASGKPVVGTRIPGISNVVSHGKNGLLVPPRDSRSLAEALLTLLNDETLRRRLGQNARRLMVKNYSWDRITNKIERVYHEAI